MGETNDDGEVLPVVGIGYSAGGLEAITSLLENVRGATGAAFIVVQHMDPREVSQLAEVLRRHTSMPVQFTEDGTELQADHVYLAPPGTQLTYEGNQMRAVRRDSEHGHNEIDSLLSSLAQGLGEHCIGVILSGTMADGVAGMSAIKAAGGYTLVQSLDTAKFRQLPAAVLDAHAMDVVLPPDELGREVQRLIGRMLGGSPAQRVEVPRSAVDSILETLLEHTGVDFHQYKHTTLLRRIDRRVVATRATNIEAYAATLAGDEQEAHALFRDLLINVTGFFRDPDFFESLARQVIDVLVADHDGPDAIRVWVPGCASGEEVYSIGIMFLEAMAESRRRIDVQIFGTDLSDSAVKRARDGVYSHQALESVSQKRRERFFDLVEGGMRVSKRLRDLCLFAVHDMTRDPPFSKLDLLSCRNVLIYMDRDLQRRVFSTFHYALRDGGVLALGPSEATSEVQGLFTPMDDGAIYRRRSVPARAATPAERAGWGRSSLEPQMDPLGSRQVARSAKELVSERFGVSAMALTPDLRVAWTQGDGSSFMQNLVGPSPGALVTGELALPIAAALEDVNRTRDAVRCTVTTPQGRIPVEVMPVGERDAATAGYVLVADVVLTQGRRPRQRFRTLLRALATPKRPSRQEELEALRGYLQHVVEDYEATTEELRSANEEALSSNEELQSTNEELGTAREELQSTNAELASVNEEMRVRNDEVVAVRDQLTQLINSLGLPIVAVGDDLVIRRFTPRARDALNLIDTDVGRPLTDINTGLDTGVVLDRIHRVVESKEPEREHIETPDGSRYELVVSPLMVEGDVVDGAVLVLMPA